jgi:hypothetical protein
MTKKEVSVRFVRHYALVKHTCPECDSEFVGPRVRRYCSVECRRRAAWKRNGLPCLERKREREQGE